MRCHVAVGANLSRMQARAWETLAVALLAAAVLGATSLAQPRSAVEWDGAVYYDMAVQVSDGVWPVHGPSPFIYRIGQPWLAAKLSPEQLTLGFLLVSWPAIILQALAFHAVLARYVAQVWVRVSCVVLYLGQFHGLARFIPFRPHMIDPPGVLAIFAGLWLVEKWREQPRAVWLALLAATAFCGAFFRESALIPALALLFARNPFRFDGRLRFEWPRARWLTLLPLAAWAAGTALVQQWVAVDPGASVLPALLGQLKAKLPHTLLVAYALTFGVLAVLPLYAFRASGDFLREHQHLAATLVVALALGVLGGSDTERLAFWGAIPMFVLIGRLIDQRSFAAQAAWLVPLCLLHALGQRWFLIMPQAGPAGGVPLLTALGPGASYEALWSSHMTRGLRLGLCAEYLLLGVAICALLRRAGVRFDRGNAKAASEPTPAASSAAHG
jgi:hypothetical protein